MSFLAPQAYTKETLAKAFDWLQHQPPSITQAATTPDNLVAIYLKAQRQGIVNMDMDAPVSSKRFIDDLKNLKKDFAPFDEEPSQKTSTIRDIPVAREANITPASNPSIQHQSIHTPSHSTASGSHTSAHRESIARELGREIGREVTHKETARETTREVTRELVREAASTGQTLHLDERTLSAVTDVQTRFNLSSPQEALRMIVSVGHDKIMHWP
jgi:hypothetical protein